MMLIFCFATTSVVGQGIIKREKCKTCGKVISLCPYKGKHPKPKPKQETKPKPQPKPAPKPRPVLYDKTFRVGGVEFVMKPVEGGTFTMGATAEQQDPRDDEKPAHQVTLSSYYIGETEVTQALWTAVMGNTVRDQRDKEYARLSIYGEGNDYPMYYISWTDCQEFISKLNRLTEQKFRLPTEAEWEYAARGGKKSRGYQYSGSNNLDDVAWYDDNSGSKTHIVKTKQPNELGIYDMSGNVFEWCQDWKGSYSTGSQTNPKGPSSGSNRVNRGGCWGSYARNCRSALRNGRAPGERDFILGLRLVLSE
ncbi:MAG: formylglycine-generating enzyme family protein [Prevotellaceae bacterium]|nr:formylglycine-generating enzyme family protein [Prevotellaceae bacterium]